MKNYFDTIVIGAGSMGMAAGYFLSKQGVKTLLIDAHNPPHDVGSHHGETRTIRHAYGEGKQYTPLVLRAQELWYELERQSNRKLFFQTGVLGIGEQGSPFIDQTIASAKEYSLPINVLRAKEVRKNWPGILIPESFVGCFETHGGVLLSEECVRAYKQLALNHKANLITDTAVEEIRFFNDGVKVYTKHDAYYAEKLIVTAGAWTGKLLQSLLLPLQPLRKTIAWIEPDEPLFSYPNFPAFFFDLNTQLYYGTPDFNGGGIKIGRHDSGQVVDPDKINRTFGAYGQDTGDIIEFLHQFMPAAMGEIKIGRVCIYTRTPDEHFIIDRHPEYPHVIIGAGFSGHGFKFSSVVGEILSQLSMTGETEHDISIFSLFRPTLKKVGQ